MKKIERAINALITLTCAIGVLCFGTLSFDQAHALATGLRETRWFSMKPDFSTLFPMLLVSVLFSLTVYKFLFGERKVYRIWNEAADEFIPYEFASRYLAVLWMNYHVSRRYQQWLHIVKEDSSEATAINLVDEIPEHEYPVTYNL